MLFVHASNVTGLGASQVVSSLIDAFISNDERDRIVFALPSTGLLSRIDIGKHKAVTFNHRLPKSLFRIVECLFPKLLYPSAEETVVLGDIPLRGFSKQIVLVHQPNLIKPHINPYSSNSVSFKIMRKLFEWNLKYVRYVVVQSTVMKDQLIKSYSIPENAVVVIPQPPPSWFSKVKRNNGSIDNGLTLFYPAAGYPHKNHKLISELSRSDELCEDIKEMITTLDDEEQKKYCFQHPKVNNIGRLSPQSCIEYYSKIDALFFPSLAESYGLPLVEAMASGIPIICSDLPYARWLCGDNAVYFDPQDVKSASRAIGVVKKRLASGWHPSWDEALSKLPATWEEVGERFFRLL